MLKSSFCSLSACAPHNYAHSASSPSFACVRGRFSARSREVVAYPAQSPFCSPVNRGYHVPLCVCVGEKWGSGWMHLSTSIIMFPSSPEEYKLPLFICRMNSLSRELQSQKRFILTPDLDDGGSLPPPPPTRAKAGFICSVHSYHPQLVNIG